MPHYKPLTKYRVTVEISGTDVYEIDSDMSEDKFREWAVTHVEILPNHHNSVEDRKIFEVINIKVVDQRPETYDKLVRYIKEMTSNEEPLKLLEQLKPR